MDLGTQTKRRAWRGRRRFMITVTLVCLFARVENSHAWMPPRLQTQTTTRSPIVAPLMQSSSSSSSSSSGRKRKKYRVWGGIINGEQEDELLNGKKRSNWKIWNWYLSKALGQGTNKVVFREAPELGGVQRSDRYSSRDWFHNTITLPNSAILRDIRSPVIAVTCWATFLSVLHHHLLKQSPATAAHLYLSPVPHSLMMSALGLLLVFRTNSAYQRFAEGRKIWEQIINSSRDLYRMVMLYEPQVGIDKRRRLQRLLAAFPYLLRHRIRPNLVMHRLDDSEHERDPVNTILLYQDAGPTDYDEEAANVARAEEETGKGRRKKRPLYWVDKRTLPWRLLPPGALEKCAQSQNRPLWVCDRMAQELRQVPDGPDFTARERLALISHVNKLSACVGGAERIHQTVVPLNYARHTLRALTVWLFSLPFCVVKELRFLTGPVLFLVAWLLFGVYEIGYAIEDPFQGSLRLSILCDTIRRDVFADEMVRRTAFDMTDTERKPAATDSGPAIAPDHSDDDDDDDDEEEEGSEGTGVSSEDRPTVGISKEETDAYQ